MSKTITIEPNSAEIQHLIKRDKRLAKIINMVGPISYQLHDDNPFAFIVHEIIEQMLSIKAGAQIYSRLVDLCDGNITPDHINKLSDEEIRKTGTSTAKVEYIRNLTAAVIEKQIDFETMAGLSDTIIIKKLTQIRGIGKWTAKMFLIFVLDRPNIIPSEDGAFLQVYRWLYKTNDCSEKAVLKKCRKWNPYATIAARYFYRALDSGLTKTEFHLYK